MRNNFTKWLKRSYIAILLMVIYVPLVFLVIWSFASESAKGNIDPNPDHWGIDNYINLFTNNDFLNSLLNTLIIMFIVTPISVFIATITCYAVWNNRRTIEKANQAMAKISLINPEIITAISLTLLFTSTWLAIGLDLGLFTIILSHISFCTPYAIISIYPRMQKFKKNLIDASRDLGYSNFKTFFNVVVPYLLPSILGAAALVAVMSFDDFIITNLVRGRTTTISTELYLMTKGIKAWAVAFAAILIIVFIIVISIRLIIGYYKNKHKKQDELIKLFNKNNNFEKNVKLKRNKDE